MLSCQNIWRYPGHDLKLPHDPQTDTVTYRVKNATTIHDKWHDHDQPYVIVQNLMIKKNNHNHTLHDNKLARTIAIKFATIQSRNRNHTIATASMITQSQPHDSDS